MATIKDLTVDKIYRISRGADDYIGSHTDFNVYARFVGVEKVTMPDPPRQANRWRSGLTKTVSRAKFEVLGFIYEGLAVPRLPRGMGAGYPKNGEMVYRDGRHFTEYEFDPEAHNTVQREFKKKMADDAIKLKEESAALVSVVRFLEGSRVELPHQIKALLKGAKYGSPLYGKALNDEQLAEAIEHSRQSLPVLDVLRLMSSVLDLALAKAEAEMDAEMELSER